MDSSKNKLIKLELVKTDFQKKLVKSIIENHHSYVPTNRSVGRRIDWLIYLVDNDYDENVFPSGEKECIGMIGIGSGVYPPPKDILTELNLSKNEYKECFNSFSNNWRFCLTKKIPNVGTRILKQLRKLAPTEWKNKYNDELKYIVTFVAGGNNGAVYKADNWKLIGKTSGVPKDRKSVSMKWNTSVELKKDFSKPTGEDRKLIFFKKL